MFKELLDILSSLFYPWHCPGCGELVEGEALLCPVCEEAVWNPRSVHPESLECSHLDGLYFLYNYEGGMIRAFHLAKFHPREDVLPRLAHALAEGMERERKMQWDIPQGVRLSLTTVPTDPARRKKRGYDIPEEIFQPWCRQKGILWEPLLQRVKPSLPQYSLNKKQRRENVSGCFAPVHDCSMPDIVLLADDICTSGATMEEGAKVLKKAGAAYVYGLALASGIDK